MSKRRPSLTDHDYFPKGFLLDLAEATDLSTKPLYDILLHLYELSSESDYGFRINHDPRYAPNWTFEISQYGWDSPISREDTIHFLHGYDPAIAVYTDDNQQSRRKRRAPPEGVENRYWAMLLNVREWNKKYDLEAFPYANWTLRKMHDWAVANKFPLPAKFG